MGMQLVKISLLILVLCLPSWGQYVDRNLSELLGFGALPGTCTIGDTAFRTDAVRWCGNSGSTGWAATWSGVLLFADTYSDASGDSSASSTLPDGFTFPGGSTQ